jgi:hypothetical protein
MLNISLREMPVWCVDMKKRVKKLSSFCFSDSSVSLYASYVNTIIHLAQNLESGLFGSLQFGHDLGLNTDS